MNAECRHCAQERAWADGTPRTFGPVRWLAGIVPACDAHLRTACEAAADAGVSPVVTRLRRERETEESWATVRAALVAAADAWEPRRERMNQRRGSE